MALTISEKLCLSDTQKYIVSDNLQNSIYYVEFRPKKQTIY